MTSTAARAQDQAGYDAWRAQRWAELAGPGGKASVVARAVVSGPGDHVIDGVPGRWSTDGSGALIVSAEPGDGVLVDGALVAGRAEVPTGQSFTLPGGRTGMVGGGAGSYGVVVLDEGALERSRLVGIDAYDHAPAWVLRGELRPVPDGRRVEVERLTVPRSTDRMPAPVDLAFTVDGVEHVLTVVEEIPGQGLVIFTDETSGTDTPEIGRWLTLPLAPPGTAVTVDLNRVTLSHHHVAPRVFTCPLAPAGNHLPFRVEAGERRLVYAPGPAS
ncbi:DUF1684 domain-containing protein [Promicromonospora citrea]|uniref:DUF1684 domain-containing protein n=1 Tax=Promicromonospora citrea TaxID=43677 RepID=A0A8H9L5U6_9MICO|nr:DUF1684 domain-containing protein [Promicromonospora citrea]NNH52256.1 DUF1684 domain-containing protein [Promicromonospora citrea]GGM40224.1 hypothetical protein GCM10010102_39770 [Promicromonospora citrea]